MLLLMFGLGLVELVVIAVVVALLGGPAAVTQLARLFKTAHKAKSQLTPQGMIGKLLEEDAPPKKRRRRKDKRAPRS